MSRIRVGRFDRTTLDARESTRIVAGEIRTKRRLRMTRTVGNFLELVIPGLSVSVESTSSHSEDVPASETAKRLRAPQPVSTLALEGPKKADRKRVPRK
jgi:hypothetical protein